MNIIRIRYTIDVFIVRVRKLLKKVILAGLPVRVRKQPQIDPKAIFSLIDKAYPWMSPNVWNEIVSHYEGIVSPVVVEFGTGASTLHHLNVMKAHKVASYIGIENNPDWFWAVVAVVLRTVRQSSSRIHVSFRYRQNESNDLDVEIQWEGVSILLRLRTTLDGYLEALDHACDVVVVDGISRKECIRKILTDKNVRTGGLLMLLEAGRGAKDWWEGKLYGEDDYSPEVDALIALGGMLIDGNGVDNWPGCTRKSPRPVSYYCPKEACKLIVADSTKVRKL